MPLTSPTVSIAEMKAIRQKPMMAAAENSIPYLKGLGKDSHAALLKLAITPRSPPKDSMPTATA